MGVTHRVTLRILLLCRRAFEIERDTVVGVEQTANMHKCGLCDCVLCPSEGDNPDDCICFNAAAE